jgi:hypothetical protein
MIESIEQMPLIGKLGITVVLLFALLWALNKMLTLIVDNYNKLVDAQVKLNESVTMLIVPKLDRISAQMETLALEDTARRNHEKIMQEVASLGKELHTVSEFLKTRYAGSNNNNVSENKSPLN